MLLAGAACRSTISGTPAPALHCVPGPQGSMLRPCMKNLLVATQESTSALAQEQSAWSRVPVRTISSGVGIYPLCWLPCRPREVIDGLGVDEICARTGAARGTCATAQPASCLPASDAESPCLPAVISSPRQLSGLLAAQAAHPPQAPPCSSLADTSLQDFITLENQVRPGLSRPRSRRKPLGT